VPEVISSFSPRRPAVAEPAFAEPTVRRAKPSWRRAPQRLWLRRAVFQVHLWLGLVLALYAVVIGLSGSALVFREEIEEAIQGGLLNIQPDFLSADSRPAHLDGAIHAIEAARPGFTGVGLRDFDRRDRAATLLMRPTHGAPTSDYRLVSFNPYTGRVLLDRQRYAGVLGWLTNLHFYLLAGEAGLRVSGLMALGLLVLCASGLVLWWPGVRRWAAALVLRRRARWQRLNWDLHSVVGFWCSATLVAVTFTGLYFAFPATVSNIVILATGGNTRHSEAVAESETKSQKPILIPMITVDQAIIKAHRALPPDAPPGYLQLPTTLNSPYRVTGYYTNTAPYSQLVQVTLDSHTGATMSSTDTRSQVLGMRIIQYFFAIHFGSFGGVGALGLTVKLLWALLGLSPALLAVTGLLMYWNRKLRLWSGITQCRRPRDVDSSGKVVGRTGQ
jgi:uncharacterized iron-regulated membrane protein